MTKTLKTKRNRGRPKSELGRLALNLRMHPERIEAAKIAAANEGLPLATWVHRLILKALK